MFWEQAKYFGTKEICKYNIFEESLVQQNYKQVTISPTIHN